MKSTFYKTILAGLVFLLTNPMQAQWTKVSTNGAADLVVHNNNLYSSTGFKTSDGTNWTNMTTFNGGNCLSVYENTLFSGGNGSTFYKSSDEGATWTQVNGRSGLSSVSMTSIYKEGTTIIYGTTGSGKWQYTNDNGSNWAGSDYPFGVSVGNIGTDFVKLNNVIYSCAYSNVFKTTDNGKNWDTTRAFGVTNGICTQGSNLYCAGYGSGISKSTDGGVSWSCVLGCSITSSDRSALRVISSGTNLFTGGALGRVNQSTDGGITWTNLSGDGTVLGSTEFVKALAVFKGQLYVSTASGIYKRDFTGGGTGLSNLTSSITLAVFPNPSQTELNISCNSIDHEKNIRITDLQGKLIYQNTHHEGVPKLDVSAWQNGVYFVHVATKDHSITQKFIKN